jgi:hypothetical protein
MVMQARLRRDSESASQQVSESAGQASAAISESLEGRRFS